MHTKSATISAGKEAMIAQKGHHADGKHHTNKEHKHYMEVSYIMILFTNILPKTGTMKMPLISKTS